MAKKFTANGYELLCVNKNEFYNVCKMFKDNNIAIDDMENWESNELFERYDAAKFIKKAHYYNNLTPPDIIQAAEKIWFAAVYTVKSFYLDLGINLKSHNSLKIFCRYALVHSNLTIDKVVDLTDYWNFAERLNRDVNGAGNFDPKDYTQLINSVEIFTQNFAEIDKDAIFRNFKDEFVDADNSTVRVAIVNEYTIKFGGKIFNCKYNVHA